MGIDTTDAVFTAIKMALVLGGLLQVTPIMVWIERRGAGLIQDRPGPNRVGPFGLIQSLADAVKFIFKEDVIPTQSNRVLYTIAPMFGLIPAVTTFAVVPFGRNFVVPSTLTYSTTVGIAFAVAIVALLLGALLIGASTAKYRRTSPSATKLNTWIGYIVAVSLFGIALLLTAAVLGFKSVGTLNVPGGGHLFEPIVADVNVGILVIFALASMGVYGLVTAGWASNNKYSLFGGIRASAQMISYELSLTLAAVGCLMAAGSLRLTDVVARQTGYFVLFDLIKIPAWNVFPMFIGFIVFFVSAFAETNRLPFDFAEAEAELVAGYHTEYSSMKFAMFFMAEYMAMTTMCAFVTTLFLGGWDIPYYNEPATFLGFALSALSFLAKVGFLLFVFVWVRWTIPRLKYDTLMRIGWKVFLPLALVNIVIVAALIALRWV
jgi:NADH-quinone oxidoreductase subunit H